MLNSALVTFDAGVSTCSSDASPMVAQFRSRLQKALNNDVTELFQKQRQQLTTSTINRFKGQLLKVMGRGGTVAEWQHEGLRRNAEKHFDAAIGLLMVDGVGDQTRVQLTTSFGKQLTELTAKFLESPPMQLQAIAAMRRKTGKAPKPPRGIRAGVGLVGALRNQFGGGPQHASAHHGAPPSSPQVRCVTNSAAVRATCRRTQATWTVSTRCTSCTPTTARSRTRVARSRRPSAGSPR